MVHDCMITKNYFILLDLPVILDMKAAEMGASLPYRCSALSLGSSRVMSNHSILFAVGGVSPESKPQSVGFMADPRDVLLLR